MDKIHNPVQITAKAREMSSIPMGSRAANLSISPGLGRSGDSVNTLRTASSISLISHFVLNAS